MIYLTQVVVFIVAGVLLVLQPSISSAESKIHLKDGRVIKVESFWREEGMVKYQNRGGIIGFSLDEVEKIVTPDMLAFDEAKKTDTVGSYENFLKSHSKSDLAAEASNRIKALNFEKVKQMNSAPVYLAYIRRNPNSSYIKEAKGRAEILIFQEAVRTGDSNKYGEYLEVYPDGKYAAASGKAVEYIKYEALKQTGTTEEIEVFLQAYPESAYRVELEQRSAQLISEANARAKALQEKEEETRRLQELAAKKKKQFWIWIIAGAAAVALMILTVMIMLRMKRQKAIALSMAAAGAAVSEGPAVSESEASEPSGPIRYEDLIGVPRKDGTLSLPDIGDGALPDPDALISLPEPGHETESSEDAAKEPDEGTIILGYGSKSDDAGETTASDKEIDLSDHETDFKLELEDVPAETEDSSTPPAVEEFSLEDEMNLANSDLPEFFDDEEVKKRRGGEIKG